MYHWHTHAHYRAESFELLGTPFEPAQGVEMPKLEQKRLQPLLSTSKPVKGQKSAGS